jgi:N,N'-diacetylchitobiose transport system substrate-binding protein
MRMRIFAVLALAAGLATVVATVSGGAAGGTSRTTAKSITVWLQTDAQADNWKPIIAAATAAFQKTNPGVDVNIQYQTWGAHLAKFDASLAGSNAPDVIEMGNTEMTKYMAAGAFQDLTADKASFPNSSTWTGLAATARYSGKTYGVPYYGGSRVVTYRKDQFSQAGIKSPPTSLGDFTADAAKLSKKFGKTKGFSPVYIAGTDWYAAMSFVFDYGGGIATQVSGKWKGLLTKPQSIAGLNAYKSFFAAASRASKTTDEAHPNPYDVMGQGQTAAILGPGWFSCCVGSFKAVAGQFVMPSHEKGKVMPGFAGGSDLAIPVGADKALAEAWIKAYTSTDSEKALQAIGNIPNTTTLLDLSKVNEKAASRSWFVPTAKNWINVENGNILRNMLAQILTGKLSVKQAAQSAQDNIESVLNAS